MKYIRLALIFISLFSTPTSYSDQSSITPEQKQLILEMKTAWDSTTPQKGKIKLPNDVATLQVPDEFYYLSPNDSETILVKLWGNPPGAGSETLGMLLPSKFTPFDDNSWAVTIEYIEDGYVSDKDAEDIDYHELLAQMKKEAKEASKLRIEQGYQPIELVGWASEPFYDAHSHKLHWAKEVKFGEQTTNTLNYNIRVLGRKGVLILNFIAGMDQKDTIDAQIDGVLALAEFDDGSRYEDFNPDIDEVAAYGLGALVAGKVAAKAGFFAAALIFLKKFGVFIFVGLGALVSKFFKRNKA